jgi:drug/metabolite transporter (DMT)-like permease
MALLSAALLAALLLVGKPIATELGGLTMAIGELTIASIVLAPAMYQAVTEWSDFWLNFIILGAVFTGLAGFVYWEAMHRLPMAAVSVIMYLEPASAVVWAAFFLDEVPNPLAWIGVAMVIGGGAIAALDSPRDVEVIRAPATL